MSDLPKIKATLYPVAFYDYANGGWAQKHRDNHLGITIQYERKNRTAKETRAFTFDETALWFDNYEEFASAYWEMHPDRLAAAKDIEAEGQTRIDKKVDEEVARRRATRRAEEGAN